MGGGRARSSLRQRLFISSRSGQRLRRGERNNIDFRYSDEEIAFLKEGRQFITEIAFLIGNIQHPESRQQTLLAAHAITSHRAGSKPSTCGRLATSSIAKSVAPSESTLDTLRGITPASAVAATVWKGSSSVSVGSVSDIVSVAAGDVVCRLLPETNPR